MFSRVWLFAVTCARERRRDGMIEWVSEEHKWMLNCERYAQYFISNVFLQILRFDVCSFAESMLSVLRVKINMHLNISAYKSYRHTHTQHEHVHRTIQHKKLVQTTNYKNNSQSNVDEYVCAVRVPVPCHLIRESISFQWTWNVKKYFQKDILPAYVVVFVVVVVVAVDDENHQHWNKEDRSLARHFKFIADKSKNAFRWRLRIWNAKAWSRCSRLLRARSTHKYMHVCMCCVCVILCAKHIKLRLEPCMSVNRRQRLCAFTLFSNLYYNFGSGWSERERARASISPFQRTLLL